VLRPTTCSSLKNSPGMKCIEIICYKIHLMESEEKLSGGNMSAVSRVGNTVRRAAGPWTPRVHQLLEHLRAKGIQEVPTPLGFDAQGREILTFIPGLVGNDPIPAYLRADEVLRAAARLLRRIHDATEDVAQTWLSGWQSPTREPVEVICHGDFAPYNCVFDQNKLVGVIDFDNAHPGNREWDLAYALYRFAPITDPSNPDHYGTISEQSRRVRLFCDEYGLQDRSQIVQSTQLRIASMADYLRQGAAKGDKRPQANIDAGHLAIYVTDHAYLEANQEQFQSALG
jgi:thiamine kinase-like enzyme